MNNAVLAFEDGSVYRGKAFGAKKTVCGDVVFNTSMIGYQELLTDPSNYKNIVNMTFVEVGCYGINDEDSESDGIKAAGLVVAQECVVPSNWRCTKTLQAFLEENGTPAISGIDTRAITKKLREKGTMKACLSTEEISDEDAVKLAQQWEGIEGVDSVKDVSCKNSYYIDESKQNIKPFEIGGVHIDSKPRKTPLVKCAVIDFGATRSLLNSLAFNGFDVTVFPATATAEEIDAFAPKCVFLSSGAGDASSLTYAHETVAKLIKKYPTFATGLGHLVLAHAMGAKTCKMKFGHHGVNYPVKNLDSDIVKITTQNISFAVEAKSVENSEAVVADVNVNDETIEGLKHQSLPVFSVSYLPDAQLWAKFYDMSK